MSIANLPSDDTHTDAQMSTPTPWSYFLIRLLFKFVLKVFYGTISVEGIEFVPEQGGCIVCANHSNSLTDALLMVTSIPSKKRGMLRLTAKSTQFGRGTFTSWLIENAGTVPIKRRRDFADGEEVDNSVVMGSLINAVEAGDAVCLFPEGASRYHPTIQPLKTGVARIISDVLSKNRDNPDFVVYLQTCSVTYMHRQHFRSDVLVTFHPPMRFSPQSHPELLTPVDYSHIRSLTSAMQGIIASGTIDSPSWDLIRTAKTATRIYAPLGTSMTLGSYVRVMRTFCEAFKEVEDGSEDEDAAKPPDDDERHALRRDLKVYQDELAQRGIKDDRVRRPLRRTTILSRLSVRLFWAFVLFCISVPGLLLWLPIFISTTYAVRNLKKSGPVWDTFDEIAQTKLTYGLISFLMVYFLSIALTLPISFLTWVAVPALMWMSLRWYEDAVSSLRAFTALLHLFMVGKQELSRLRSRRENIRERLMVVAVNELGMPSDPETYFTQPSSGDGEKGRQRSGWRGGAKYFSVRRRRKRDWNETLRLYDMDFHEERLRP